MQFLRLTLKEFSGLGLMDLGLKNKTLLNEWIWIFGEELEALWRSVIWANMATTI